MKTNKLQGGKKGDVTTVVTSPMEVNVSVSQANPKAPMNSIPAMSFQRNQYQKDVYTAAVAASDYNSVNEFLREAGLKLAKELGIK